MDEETIKKLKEQHIENYRKAIIENIKNNTNVLVEEDLMSLFRKPPLDSMDFIKTKFLDLAKKNKIVLDTEKLDKILDNYRNMIIKCCGEIKDRRITELSENVEKTVFSKVSDVIKINKKDFTSINKDIKKTIKSQLVLAFDEKILKNIDSVFADDIDSAKKEKIINEITKYVKGTYQKQLLESVDIKVLVKDTTLINGAKEQAERYLFTLNNSRLFNDDLSN